MSRFSLCVSVCCAALSFTSVSTCACLYVPRRVPRVFPLVPVYVCRAEFRECFHLYLSMCAVQSSASVSTCTCLYVPLRVPRVFPPVPVYMCRAEFRECFHLYARQRQVHSVDQLATIMRCLRLSPTSTGLRRYLKQKGQQEIGILTPQRHIVRWGTS